MYQTSVFIFLIAAIYWIGGRLTIAAISVSNSREPILVSIRDNIFMFTARESHIQILLNVVFWKAIFDLASVSTGLKVVTFFQKKEQRLHHTITPKAKQSTLFSFGNENYILCYKAYKRQKHNSMNYLQIRKHIT